MYQVSSIGRVRNKKTRLIRTPTKGENPGYYQVDLYKSDGKRHGYTKSIHRLVAEAFLGKRENMQVNHIDGNKLNNKIDNLEWVTCSENIQHAYDTGLKYPPNEKKVRIVETIKGDWRNVSACLNNKRDTCNGLHFEFVDDDYKNRKTNFLRGYQLEAVNELHNGCILCGSVGSGKSRTGLFYYFKENGGWIDEKGYTPMKNSPQDLYIITTAKKRDSLEWERELIPFNISNNPEKNKNYRNKVIIDSWNNIGKYKDIEGAFFLLDEQRIVGNGAWVKAFLKIAKSNNWILLTATPGDSYSDYIPVFLANGFFKNRTEFNKEHVIYSRFTKFPQIERYVGTKRLDRLRDRVLVKMNYQHDINYHHEDIYCDYDIRAYKDINTNRFDPYKDEPIQQASGLCYVLRRLVNSDDSRQIKVLDILEKHPRAIIFYNFNYELDILKNLDYPKGFKVAEYNGQKHQPIPKGDKWVYLCQYNSCSEGWECILTNCIIFFSQNYSYKIMTQAAGRIDRLNTPYTDLYYYHLKSRAPIDLAISKALTQKKKFNERKFTKWE